MRWNAIIVTCACALVAGRARAQEVMVRVVQAGACPAPEAVADELARLRPAVHVVDEGGELLVVEDLDHRYRVFVAGIDRMIEDPRRRCDERAKTSALIAALALDAAGPPHPIAIAPPPPPPPPPEGVPVRPAPPRARLLIGVGVGTAQTYLGGGAETEVAWQLKTDAAGQALYRPARVADPGGIAYALLHLRADLGVRLVDTWELLGSLRAQIVVGPTAHTLGTDDGSPPVGGTEASRAAVAGLLRARRRFVRGPIAPFIEVALGGGQVRPTIDLSAAQTVDRPLVDEATARAYNADPATGGMLNRQRVCPAGGCVDTVRLQGALVGVGAGMQIRLVEQGRAELALTAGTTFLGALGPRAQGLVVDWDLGLLVRAW